MYSTKYDKNTDDVVDEVSTLKGEIREQNVVTSEIENDVASSSSERYVYILLDSHLNKDFLDFLSDVEESWLEQRVCLLRFILKQMWKDLTFGRKDTVKVDDLIGDASSCLPSFFHHDEIITTSEADYVKALRLCKGDNDKEEASALESGREIEETTLEGQADNSATDDCNTDENYKLTMAAGTRTRNRRKRRRLEDFVALRISFPQYNEDI